MFLPNHPSGDRPKPKRRSTFRTDEDGGMTIFSLFIFILMLLLSGMAVDLMRFETQRVRLQNTIDTSVLAAANLNQDADPEPLIRDFFDKVGYDGSLVQVSSLETSIGEDASGNGGQLVGRTVRASMDIDVNTYFMGLLGIENLRGVSAGRATESAQGIEISLVVDISGSMGGQKLTNLKTSATNFINILLDEQKVASQLAATSISIIPYNATVVVPDALLDRLNTQATIPTTPAFTNYADPTEFAGALTVFQREAPQSKCVYFNDSQMTTTDLAADFSALRSIDQTTYLSRIGYFNWGDPSAFTRPNDAGQRWCDPTRSEIIVHETRKDVLNTAISNLQAGGWTSIDMGMKWGTALLDPAMRPVINEMVDGNILTGEVRDRPANYGGVETQKIVVLMTDGANTVQRDLDPQFKIGPSPIWFSASAAGANFEEGPAQSASYFDGFIVQTGSTTNTDYWYQTEDPDDRSDGEFYDRAELNSEFPDARQLSWNELFNRFARRDVAKLVRDPSGQDVDALDDLYDALDDTGGVTHNAGELDFRLFGDENDTTIAMPSYGICDAAKVNNDILVYTIAFAAPAGGQKAMSECASDSGYYFDAANGAQLEAAFQAIAAQITQLRLTQ